MAFSTMYIAATGMQALGTGMQTISNNLANIETVGFKTMRTNYEDLISQCYFSSGNHNQVGKGSKVSTIQSMFTQGAFRANQGDTDMAIAGDGFFNVRSKLTGDIMYTRAGVYTFSKDGYLEDPSGNILQGWQMSIPKAGQSAQRIGNPVDIRITSMTAPPLATSSIKLAVNLNAGDKSAYYYPATEGATDSEGAGYAGAWNARNSPAIDDGSYTYSEPLTVYDQAGTKHTLMVYYQKNPHMENVWDYIITNDPLEDGRPGADGEPLFAEGATFAGLVQKGKITFNAKDDVLGHGGLIKSIEAQNLDLANTLAASTDAPVVQGGTGSAMAAAAIGGYFTASPVYDTSAGQYVSAERTYTLTWGYQDPDTGVWQANTNGQPPTSAITWVDDQGNRGVIPVSDKSYAGPYNFGSGLSVTFGDGGAALNFGTVGQDAIVVVAHGEQTAWTEASLDTSGHFTFDLTVPDASSGLKPPYPADAPTLTQTVSLDMGATGAGTVWTPGEVATTQYAAKSSTTAKESDGYPESSLQRVYVREDGVVMGVYDKKREEELFQVGLTRFLNPWGLDKKGDNLFAQSRYSGEGYLCAPGEDGAGTILGNFLEQSNVDTATEIVQMILTQRGFQANSKAITTNDTMLATAIQTKR